MYRRAAAAVAAVALVGLGLYLWGSGGEEQGGEEIAPGGYRAILIVGDASPISIGEGARGALLADSSVVVENNLLIQATPREKGPDRVVVTPRGGEFPLALADGTRVWLNAETRLTFPAAFDDSTRAVTLSGEAYFEVARDEARPFIVKTSRSLVRVYGTSFNARAYPDDARQRITLERGSLGVRVGEREYLLRPGEQASTTANGETTVTLADARKQGVWREGKFAFERESLEEIMKQLARWYNVEVVFADRRAGQLHFSGELNRYNDLGRLLKMIELTTRIEFEIKERTIIVHAR